MVRAAIRFASQNWLIHWFFASMLCLFLTWATILYLDHPVANLFFNKRIQGLPWQAIGNVPRAIALIGIVLLFLGFTFALTLGSFRRRLKMLGAAGVSLFLAYSLNLLVLKPAFGRTSPVSWIYGGVDEFRFFDAGVGIGAFPSGHAAMIFALMTTLWLTQSAYRIWIAMLTLAVCFGMLVFELHYLSDLIAGGFIGASVARLVCHFFGMVRSGNASPIGERCFT